MESPNPYTLESSGVKERNVRWEHTGRERLLELLSLVGVLEDKGVEMSAAADLELDL